MGEAGTQVGAQIRRLRKAKDWTVAQLAVYADMSPSAVSQIETGRRSPTAASMSKLAEALEVEVRDLFPLEQQAPLPDFGEERREAAEDAVLDAARRQAKQDKQAAARAFVSERPQTYFMRHENEVVHRLLEYSTDELAGALIELGRRCVQLEEAQAERHPSILAKAIAAGTERWAHIASNDSTDRDGAFGIYLVATDLENLLSVVIGDQEVAEQLSNQERSEIASVMATLGRVTEGYHARREEEHATEQRREMVRQWTHEISKIA